MDTLTPLRDRRFRMLWAGQTVSLVGDAVGPVALTLAIVTATGSAEDLGLVLASEVTPQVLLLLLGGVWADRFPRQRVMLSADVIRCLAYAVIAAELIAGNVDVMALAVPAACAGGASAFFLPATTGLVPATVPADQLGRANAIMSVSTRGALLAGPLIATAVTLSVGAGWALALNAATFAVSAVTLARLPIAPQAPRARESIRTQLVEGWVVLRRHQWYWTNLVVHSVWNLGRCVFVTVGPLLAVRELGGELAWGMVVQGGAIGAILGALVALRVRPRRTLLLANLVLIPSALPFLLLAARAPTLAVAGAGALMYGGVAIMSPLWDTTVQRHIPEEAISRVSSYEWLVSLGLTPLGMALAGPFAAAVGTTSALGGAGVLVALSCLTVLAIPAVRRLEVKPGVHDRPVVG